MAGKYWPTTNYMLRVSLRKGGCSRSGLFMSELEAPTPYQNKLRVRRPIMSEPSTFGLRAG